MDSTSMDSLIRCSLPRRWTTMDWRRRAEEDKWVVPYCAALLEFADCHLHFDVVYTAKDDIGEDFSGERRSLDIIENISQLADAVDFLLPPHILADPFACLERTFLSPRNALVDEFNDFLLDTLPGFLCTNLTH